MVTDMNDTIKSHLERKLSLFDNMKGLAQGAAVRFSPKQSKRPLSGLGEKLCFVNIPETTRNCRESFEGAL